MKTFTVAVTQHVQVTLDETKFTSEFFSEFNSTISNWGNDLEKHAEHLAWVQATGLEDMEGGNDPFVEGYGPIKDMGISVKVDVVDIEVFFCERWPLYRFWYDFGWFVCCCWCVLGCWLLGWGLC